MQYLDNSFGDWTILFKPHKSISMEAIESSMVDVKLEEWIRRNHSSSHAWRKNYIGQRPGRGLVRKLLLLSYKGGVCW